MRYQWAEIVRKRKVSINMKITAFHESKMNCAAQTKREERKGFCTNKMQTYYSILSVNWIDLDIQRIHNRSRHSSQMHFIDVVCAVRAHVYTCCCYVNKYKYGKSFCLSDERSLHSKTIQKQASLADAVPSSCCEYVIKWKKNGDAARIMVVVAAVMATAAPPTEWEWWSFIE